MDEPVKRSENEKRGRSIALISTVALVGLAVGLGVGIGIGAGIWKDSCSDTQLNSAGLSSTDLCDVKIEHDDSLYTYILSIGEYSTADGGEFVNVNVPKASLPPVMPYVINDAKNGSLYENVMNTTMFLEDWALLSSQANESAGEFAMPAYAAAKQCYQDYQMQTKTADVPANAMVVFHDDNSVERLAHVYSVTEEQDGFIFTLLPVTEDDPSILPEGTCHPYQSLSDPHFHHTSTCLQYDGNWALGTSNVTEGSGLTAFIKFGPLVDAGIAGAAADLIGTDAAVDTGVVAGDTAASDVASDVGADVASDAGSDAGYDGDDIVSDASSDGASDRADTEIGDNQQQGGGGIGAGTVATGAGAVVGGAGAVAASGPQAESQGLDRPPRG
ncbi:hypothetical protein M9434_003466 [Picochlorum sp. BPE23]|nr:hypothetical protein M9434_003466 [Picochlorum sp. BPE23]